MYALDLFRGPCSSRSSCGLCGGSRQSWSMFAPLRDWSCRHFSAHRLKIVQFGGRFILGSSFSLIAQDGSSEPGTSVPKGDKAVGTDPQPLSFRPFPGHQSASLSAARDAPVVLLLEYWHKKTNSGSLSYSVQYFCQFRSISSIFMGKSRKHSTVT